MAYASQFCRGGANRRVFGQPLGREGKIFCLAHTLPSVIWVCLKIGKTPKPNGFADHYPVFKWLFHWEYTLFSDKPICEHTRLQGYLRWYKSFEGNPDDGWPRETYIIQPHFDRFFWYIIAICSMVLVYLPTFARTKSPSFVGKYTSTMDPTGYSSTIWFFALLKIGYPFPATESTEKNHILFPMGNVLSETGVDCYFFFRSISSWPIAIFILVQFLMLKKKNDKHTEDCLFIMKIIIHIYYYDMNIMIWIVHMEHWYSYHIIVSTCFYFMLWLSNKCSHCYYI